MKSGLLVKITIPVVALAISGLAMTSILGYTKSRDAIERAITEQQLQAVDSIARNAQFWMKSRVLEAKSWASTNLYQKSLLDSFLGKTARNAASKRLSSDKQNYQVYRALHIVNAAGEIVASSESDDASRATRYANDKAFKAASSGQFTSIHAIQDPSTGKPISVLYAPIETDGAGDGVLVVVIDLSTFESEFIVPLKSGATGTARVLDEDGVVILDALSNDYFTANLKKTDLATTMADSNRGSLRYHESGMTQVAAYRKIDELGWTAIASASEDEVFASVRSARLVSLITSVVFAFIIGVGVYIVVNATLKPIRQMVEKFRDLSEGQGDLTRRLNISSNDEVAELGQYFNKFIDKLQGMILNIRHSTFQMAEASQDLFNITEKTNASITQQRQETESISSAVNEMAATARSVAQSATEASTYADEAKTESHNGRSVVEKTINAISELATEVEVSTKVIQALHSESEKIGGVLDVIKGIAEQTNLLALNAAIEAARAGDLGRGFAVVADEVRTLAQRTQKSTQEIDDMISSLQNEAGKAITSIVSSQNLAHETVKQAGEAGVALESISNSILNITDMNYRIANASEEQSAVTDEVTRNITNIYELTNETVTAAERTFASSKKLAGSSEALSEIVNQFKVTKDSGGFQEL